MLDAVQMDSKAQSPSEQTLAKDEANTQSPKGNSSYLQTKSIFLS